MSEGAIKTKPLGLSVVMPAYNAAEWLEPTVEKIIAAMKAAAIGDFEIIIVDDGSSDKTKNVAESLLERNRPHIKVLSHPNQGRYLTRKRGVEMARYERILFIDTRVWIDEGALNFLKDQLTKFPDRLIWNGHINVAKKGNIIARFGDALTILGWRRYFKNPRLTSYGLGDFDHYPKGTGLFTVPKMLITEAFDWFEANTTDIKNSSDDTLLIRHLTERNRIWLSPEFSATYFARTTLKAFIKHTYYRGQFFVDGFLRKGTRFYYPLLAVIYGMPFLFAFAVTLPYLFVSLPIFLILTLLLGVVQGLSYKDGLALMILLPVFIPVYLTGIYRGYIRYLKQGA